MIKLRFLSFSGEMGTVAGWGRLSEGGQLPNILQYVSGELFENRSLLTIESFFRFPRAGLRANREQLQVQEHVSEGREARGHPRDLHVRRLRRGRTGLLPGLVSLSRRAVATLTLVIVFRATPEVPWLCADATVAGSWAASSAGASGAPSPTCRGSAQGYQSSGTGSCKTPPDPGGRYSYSRKGKKPF